MSNCTSWGTREMVHRRLWRKARVCIIATSIPNSLGLGHAKSEHWWQRYSMDADRTPGRYRFCRRPNPPGTEIARHRVFVAPTSEVCGTSWTQNQRNENETDAHQHNNVMYSGGRWGNDRRSRKLHLLRKHFVRGWRSRTRRKQPNTESASSLHIAQQHMEFNATNKKPEDQIFQNELRFSIALRLRNLENDREYRTPNPSLR